MASPLETATKRLIWERYEQRRPRPGVEYDAFLEETAAELNLERKQVSRCIASESNALQNQIRRATMTQAQIVAEQLGIDMVTALNVWRDGMQAVKRKPLLDKSGRPIRNDAGEIEYQVDPDHAIRMQAAHRVAQVHAMYAPQQYEVKGEVQHNHAMMDESTLRLEIAELQRQLGLSDASSAIIDVLPGNASAAVGAGAVGAGSPQGNQGDQGLLLLADSLHGDKGRAGQNGKPVQTVPVKAIHPATNRRFGPRTRYFDRKKPNHDGNVDGGGVGESHGVHPSGD